MSPRHSRRLTVSIASVALWSAAAARGQCPPQWSLEFANGTINGTVAALAVFDDDGPGPNGPALFVGGNFDGAFGTSAQTLVKWDGSSGSPVATFQPLYSWQSPTIYEMQAFDPDGAGPAAAALYLTGQFSAIDGVPIDAGLVRWDGNTWTQVGASSVAIEALTVLDDDLDSPGPASLYAGVMASDSSSHYFVARLVDGDWLPLPGAFNGIVLALTIHDEDGQGPSPPALYAGGAFTHVGSVAANRVARWNGVMWIPLSGGIQQCSTCNPPKVYALASFDEDGEGALPPALFAGGDFFQVDGLGIEFLARWDGQAWSHVGAGVDEPVRSMLVFHDDSDGPNPRSLFATGAFDGYPFTSAYVAKWTGAAWVGLAGGTSAPGAFALAAFDDDGDGPLAPALYVGGDFESVSGFAADHVARWGAGGSPPVIWQQADVVVFPEGESTSNELYVLPFWTSDLTFQWRKDGVPLPEDEHSSNTHTPVLQLSDVFASDAGTYDAVISNGCGDTLSEPITVLVDLKPVIIAANPPHDNPYLPGQQPFRDVLQTGGTPAVTQGIGGAGTPPLGSVSYDVITVTFNEPLPEGFNVWSYGSPVDVIAISGSNPYQLTLEGPIPPGATAIFNFPDAALDQELVYESLPGDVSMDGLVSTSDLLHLLSAMQAGIANLPENLPRYDINRSGSVSTQDLLRLIQLFNGVNTSQAWIGATLDGCS